MTKEEFGKLPYLLTVGQTVSCGYCRRTLDKYAAAEVLKVIKPKGAVHRKFQKKQIAQLLGWEKSLDTAAWGREKPLLSPTAVYQWTGYDRDTLAAMVAAGGLTRVMPAGMGEAKYRKEEIASWIGL